MAHYRLYRLDGTGRIVSAEWLEAEDDARAELLATERCNGTGAVELWTRNRMIARVESAHRT